LECAVTRDQLRALTSAASSVINETQWNEVKDDPDKMAAFRESFLKAIEARATQTDVDINKVGDDWKIEDSTVLKDVSPLVISQLNNAVKRAATLHKKDEGSWSGVSASTDNNCVSSDDIKWDVSGEQAIPKKIHRDGLLGQRIADLAHLVDIEEWLRPGGSGHNTALALGGMAYAHLVSLR
jgi:hypothetical protein